jgi:uncharacterized damage-inducible protein DinB
MADMKRWASILGSSLTWEQAHASLNNAVKNLPVGLRGERPTGYPHSVWELLEHIRLSQRDLLDFCTDPDYREKKWPDDYWPADPAPPGDSAWEECLAEIARDAAALAKFAEDNAAKLTEKIPHGTGQTYLRTVLVAVDHTAYHVGQIVAVRRLLGAWPAPG